jgi:hypothetical protein
VTFNGNSFGLPVRYLAAIKEVSAPTLSNDLRNFRAKYDEKTRFYELIALLSKQGVGRPGPVGIANAIKVSAMCQSHS